MPSNATRPRIDWVPGGAALEALEIAERLYPHLRRQAVIDMLVINGLFLLRRPPWVPPQLWGNNRDQWRLPPELLPPKQIAEIPGSNSQRDLR